MNTSNLPEPDWSDPIVKWLLGFFGAVFGFLLLPKAIKLFVRRFLFGILGEVIFIVVAGLLTEKAVDAIGEE